MNKTCSICGNVGEPEIKDGKYICKSCGCTIGAVPEEEKTEAPKSNAGVTVNTLECPICKNKSGNTVKDGKAKCSLCGTEFDPTAKSAGGTGGNTASVGSAGGDDEFTKEKNKNIIIGVVLLFLFWPASIYFFYKAYKMGDNK